MSLFAESCDLAPQAARLRPKLHALADEGIYFGTPSWKYEGWLGSFYSEARYQTRGKLSKKALPQNLWVEKRGTGSAQARQEGLHSHLHLRSAPVK
jgi:hypothetical protein